MMTHSELADYVRSLSDAELIEFAARITAWRLAMRWSEYDEPRKLVIRALAACSNGFADRDFVPSYHAHPLVEPGSPWGRVHARARVLLSDLTPERARAQIVAWARTVRLVAA